MALLDFALAKLGTTYSVFQGTKTCRRCLPGATGKQKQRPPPEPDLGFERVFSRQDHLRSSGALGSIIDPKDSLTVGGKEATRCIRRA